MNKKSFILHVDSLDIVDDMSDDQAGQLLKAIKAFQHGVEIELTPLVKMAFIPLKNQFIRDGIKYEKASEINRINGYKGGKRTQANARKRKRLQANQADNDNDNDNDNGNVSKKDSDNKKERVRAKRFAPPTINQIETYVIEKNYYVDAHRFFNHYESNGWKVGKNPMKSWKAAISSWNGRDQPNKRHERKKKANDDFNKWLDEDDAIEGECNVVN